MLLLDYFRCLKRVINETYSKALLHLKIVITLSGGLCGVRNKGDLPIPAFRAALNAYKRHEGEADYASRQVQEYIAFVTSIDPKKYWASVYNERWITNR